jgi:hypothetical protein
VVSKGAKLGRESNEKGIANDSEAVRHREVNSMCWVDRLMPCQAVLGEKQSAQRVEEKIDARAPRTAQIMVLEQSVRAQPSHPPYTAFTYF